MIRIRTEKSNIRLLAGTLSFTCSKARWEQGKILEIFKWHFSDYFVNLQYTRDASRFQRFWIHRWHYWDNNDWVTVCE
jgi:hypothetical protein